MPSETLTFERTVNAPASQVYRAFTSATALREWFCDAALADPRPGGRLYFWWNQGYYACGEFTALTEDQQIAFTWHGRGEPDTTRVGVSLEPANEETRVTVTHSGIGTGAAWAETVKQFERGWEVGLENLQSVLETGRDLRYVRRPMLGVTVDEFNAETAAQLGVPVTEGIRLERTLE
ncbi:MAG: SRPBCC domain-containing protein, partial [Anaerolineae bacterium]